VPRGSKSGEPRLRTSARGAALQPTGISGDAVRSRQRGSDARWIFCGASGRNGSRAAFLSTVSFTTTGMPCSGCTDHCLSLAFPIASKTSFNGSSGSGWPGYSVSKR
jgi:hypothetical protein